MVMEGLRRVLIVVDSKNGLTSFVTREPPAAVPQTSWHAMYNGGIGSFSNRWFSKEHVPAGLRFREMCINDRLRSSP